MAAIRFPGLVTLTLAAGLAACSNSSGTGRVNLQLSTRSPAPMAAATNRPQLSTAALGQATIALGGDQIVVDRVEIVLRKIKFEGVSAGGCAAVPDGGTEVGSEVEDCGEFRAGPELFDLPLGDGVVQTYTATVPAGSYSEVQFQIHRPTDQNGDAAFLVTHPEFAGTSIRVTGTYQKAGDPSPVAFIYTTDLTEVVNVGLQQPIDVAEGSNLAVTLAIDLAGWFANADASGLVDPSEALNGQPLESLVEQNIRSSFHVFEDENGDGAAD
jgi:hypothetical protein